MFPHGSGTSASDSFNDSQYRRPTSPLVTAREAVERTRLHEELITKAESMFSQSKTLVDQLDSMHSVCDAFGKWSLTTEVQGKLDAFKAALLSDANNGGEKLWDLIQADLIISSQQAKMNEILVKSNADLKLQLAFARETVHRKQNEAIETVKSVVAESLTLLKTREEEAFSWKNLHREQLDTNESLGKELKHWKRKSDEAATKIASLESTRIAMSVDLEQLTNQMGDKENVLQKLAAQLLDLQNKNRELQFQIDQKTEEVVSLDHDVRKASADSSDMREKHQKELEKYTQAFNKKLNDDLNLQSEQLTADHNRAMDQLHNQMAKLENDRDMLRSKLADYKNHAEQLQNENDYLKKNAKKIKHDLISQCQRRVFSALNYDTQSNDSSSPIEHPKSVRSKSGGMVTFDGEVESHYTAPRTQVASHSSQKPPVGSLNKKRTSSFHH